MKQRGFTLFELMIVVGILAIFSGAAIFALRGCGIDNKATAEEEAMQYALSLGLNNPKATCTNVDTDNDGYVSCSISHKNDGKVEIIPVECAKKLSRNNGCKQPQQIIQRRFW